jgi:hypothetical protein
VLSFGDGIACAHVQREVNGMAVQTEVSKLCGWQDDDHAACCPVPALEEWINPSTLD